MVELSEGLEQAHNVIVFLDILLSILIIGGAYFIVQTRLGAATISFGFIMLTVTLILKIIQKW